MPAPRPDEAPRRWVHPGWILAVALVLVAAAGLLGLATSTESSGVSAAPAGTNPARPPVGRGTTLGGTASTTTTEAPTSTDTAAPEPAAAPVDDDGPPPVLRPDGSGAATDTGVPLPRYAVTVTSYAFVDGSRPTPMVSGTGGAPNRTLPTTVWLPAAPGAYPVVVFAHGYAATAGFYRDLLAEVASYGYVVAAPEFPLTSRARTGLFAHDDVLSQPGDLSFVTSQLLALDGSDPVLTGHLLHSRIAVMGHSDGGLTAVAAAYNACCRDARFRAAVVLSGQASGFGPVWFPAGSPPMLAVHGTADSTNPLGRSLALFSAAPSPKFMLQVLGGSHEGPFTTDPVRPQVSRVIVDFLRAELQGDQGAANRLPVDGNVAGQLQLQVG